MDSQSRAGGAKILFLLTLIVASVVALALTNPTRQEHEDALYARLAEMSRDELKKDGLLGVLAASLVDETTIKVFATKTRYHNYVLYSKMTVDGATVTWGVLRNVVVKE